MLRFVTASPGKDWVKGRSHYAQIPRRRTRPDTCIHARVHCNRTNRTHWKQLLVKFTIINSRQHVMMSCTWGIVTSSDDVKLYVGWMMLTSNTQVILVHPAAWITVPIIPLSSMTIGVGDTGVKTFLQRCRRAGRSARAFWLRMNDPARWTVDVDRWCRIDVTATWVTQDKHNKQNEHHSCQLSLLPSAGR